MIDDLREFIEVERAIATEKGQFSLFALVLRSVMVGVVSTSSTSAGPFMQRWDLVVSAPWLDPDRRAPLEHIASRITHHAGKKTLRRLAGVVALPVSHAAVEELASLARTRHGFKEIPLANIPPTLGGGVERMIVITSQRLPAKRAAG